MSFPWPDSLAVFLLALVAAQVLAILWHEAGHALANRLAGLNVLAWGLGFREPWFRLRLGQTWFYLGRPISMGLTIWCRNTLDRMPLAEGIGIAGGPLASWAGLAAGLVAWWWGLHSDALLAWIAISAIICLSCSFPSTYKRGGLWLENDAMLLVNLFRFGRQSKTPPLGPTLGSMRAMRDLLHELRHRDGENFLGLSISLVEAALGNLPAARESLQAATASPSQLPAAPRLAALARSTLAVEETSPDAAQVLDAAAPLCASDATCEFLFNCLRAQYEVGRAAPADGEVVKEDTLASLKALRQYALDARRGDWVCLVDQLLFLADTGERPELECYALLARDRAYLGDVAKARLLAITTERLAAIGRLDEARKFFSLARQEITQVASTIASPETKQAYLKQAAAPLQRAVLATGDQLPLYLGDVPRRPPSKGLARAAMLAAVTTFSAATLTTIAVFRERPPTEKAVQSLLGWITLCCITSVLCALLSGFRRELLRKTTIAAVALSVTGLLMAAVVTQPSFIKHRRLQRWNTREVEVVSDESDDSQASAHEIGTRQTEAENDDAPPPLGE